MENALLSVFYIFNKWIDLVFNQMTFNFMTYTASLGWLIIAATVISMIIGSIMNIPSKLPGDAFYTGTERIKRDVYRNRYNRRVSWLGSKLWRR